VRIFLTGGTGFIGRQVLRRLLAAGHEVCCLGRPRQMSAGERWHDCRLEESDRLAEILAEFQPEACLHLAWYAEPGRYLESPLNLELVGQSVRLCELAAAAGCRRFVGAGSCSEYDVRGGLLGEESPTVPSTLYAAAKLSAGQLCRVVAERNAMSFAWGRIFYVYGPGEDGRRFVPTAIRSLLAGEPFAITSGRMIRDYLSVHDVAAAFVRLTESVAEGVYNVCSGEPITISAPWPRRSPPAATPRGCSPSAARPAAVSIRRWCSAPTLGCGPSAGSRRSTWPAASTRRSNPAATRAAQARPPAAIRTGEPISPPRRRAAEPSTTAISTTPCEPTKTTAVPGGASP